jgi:PadR family transcriptional regulator PadR
LPSKSKNDILQGTLALLVLRTVDAHGPVHGYAITSHIHRISGELLRVEEGSLYPALHRMEVEGWIKADWRVTDKGRQARFYKLTPAGRKQLAAEQASWDRLTSGVALVLGQA